MIMTPNRELLLLGDAPEARSLLSNLTAYWPLDEASGTRRDLSGNGLTLTDNNSTLSGAGPSGKLPVAADFNGTNQSLSRAGETVLQFGVSAATVALWCNLDSVITANKRLFEKYSNPLAAADSSVTINHIVGVGFRASWIDGALNFQSVTATTTGVAQVGKWYFIVFGFKNGTGWIEINGVRDTQTPVASQTINSGSTSTPLVIGASNAADQYVDGKENACGIWKREWSPSECQYIYNNGAGRRLIVGRGFV